MLKKIKPRNIHIYLFFKIWNAINIRRKKQLFLVSILMILSGLSEMLTLASLVPFLSVITNPSEFWEIRIVQKVALIFGVISYEDLMPIVTILFISAVCLSAIVRLLNLWINIKLSALIGSDFACKTYENVLSRQYSSYLNSSSSKTISTLTSKVPALCTVVTKYLQFFTAFVVIVGILLTLILIEKTIAIFVPIVFGVIYLIIGFILNKKLKVSSKIIATSSDKMVKSVQQGLGHFREIILEGNQKYFLSDFKKYDFPMRLGYAKNLYFAMFPRYILETIGIIIISLIAYSLTQRDAQSISLISFLGILTLGVQRILPSIQIIYSSWAEISGYSKPTLDVLEIVEENKKFYNLNNIVPIEKFTKIEFKNVSFKYSKNDDFILKNISTEIYSGDVVGIIGKTGSGKSTFIDLLMGLLQPTMGEILIDGKNINKPSNRKLLSQWRKSLAHVPQSIFLSEGTIKENISLGINDNLIRNSEIKNSAKIAFIDEFINSLDLKYNTYVGERGVKLSGGQVQRIGIARALFKKKKVLILDEATSALDTNTEENVILNIGKEKIARTIIMISHRHSTLDKCNKLIEIKKGKLLEVKN